jgi:hypothetical protein
LWQRGDESVDATVETPATDTDTDDDDATWPLLSELDLQVCLTDSVIPGTATGRRSPAPDRLGLAAS